MAPPSDWTFLIATQRANEQEVLGTGTVIAPGRILTARHVVCDKNGNAEPGLLVHREGGAHFRPATILWAGSRDLDVAVLQADIGDPSPKHSLMLLSARDFDGGKEWCAQGYPAVREKKPSNRLEKVRGKTVSYRRGDRDISVDVEASPDKFGGLSGAAVIVAEQIVGVIRAVPTGWNGKRLEATPVAEFLDFKEFRDALGLKPIDEKLVGDVLDLERDVATQLKKLAAITDALAKNLDVDAAPEDRAHAVAHAMVHSKSGEDLVYILNVIDEEIKDDATRVTDRHELQALLWKVLPFATDWRPWVLTGRAAIHAKGTFVDLPLGTLTMAEAVLAGIDCRPCRYHAEQPNRGPVGFALIEQPATEKVPYLDLDRRGLVEATVGHLATKLRHYPPGDPALREHERMKREVDEHLKSFIKNPRKNERVPRWLLLEEKKPDREGKGPEGSDERITAAVMVLGEALPHLRILRMGGGVPGEAYLALLIGSMWQNRVADK